MCCGGDNSLIRVHAPAPQRLATIPVATGGAAQFFSVLVAVPDPRLRIAVSVFGFATTLGVPVVDPQDLTESGRVIYGMHASLLWKEPLLGRLTQLADLIGQGNTTGNGALYSALVPPLQGWPICDGKIGVATHIRATLKMLPNPGTAAFDVNWYTAIRATPDVPMTDAEWRAAVSGLTISPASSALVAL